jgi:hypothetical protein
MANFRRLMAPGDRAMEPGAVAIGRDSLVDTHKPGRDSSQRSPAIWLDANPPGIEQNRRKALRSHLFGR